MSEFQIDEQLRKDIDALIEKRRDSIEATARYFKHPFDFQTVQDITETGMKISRDSVIGIIDPLIREVIRLQDLQDAWENINLPDNVPVAYSTLLERTYKTESIISKLVEIADEGKDVDLVKYFKELTEEFFSMSSTLERLSIENVQLKDKLKWKSMDTAPEDGKEYFLVWEESPKWQHLIGFMGSCRITHGRPREDWKYHTRTLGWYPLPVYPEPIPTFNLPKDLCMKLADLEGDDTVGAGKEDWKVERFHELIERARTRGLEYWRKTGLGLSLTEWEEVYNFLGKEI